MKKRPRRILYASLLLLAALLLAALLIFRNELMTLASLKKVDAHPLYQMAYHGDYGFNDFLKTGARSDEEIERFIMKRLLKGIDIDLNIASAACSAFCATNEQGQRIFARNFDFDPAPALLLKTDPDDGYSSLGIVNLAFAGYGGDYLPTPYTFSNFLTLAAPYLPFDGMNEKGVAMALLAVPHAEPPVSGDKIMLNTTTMIRLVLDRAASVEEALDITSPRARFKSVWGRTTARFTLLRRERCNNGKLASQEKGRGYSGEECKAHCPVLSAHFSLDLGLLFCHHTQQA